MSFHVFFLFSFLSFSISSHCDFVVSRWWISGFNDNCRTAVWTFFRCIDDYAFGVDLGAPFFPGGHELWHHPLAYSAAAAAELPSAALQHATLVHPALHPQVPVRSYLWLNPEKMIDQPMHQVSTVSNTRPLIFLPLCKKKWNSISDWIKMEIQSTDSIFT